MSVTGQEAVKGPNRAKPITIVVNGEEKPYVGREISFSEVVELAFGAEPPNPNICFTMTFKNASGKRKEGTLVEGDSVKIKGGTVFNVTRTDNS